MADGNGVVSGGEPGDLELSTIASRSGSSPRQAPGAESGALESNSPANPSSGGNLGPQPPQSVAVTVCENFPQLEVHNILAIKGNTELCGALKEWDRKELYLSNRVDRKEKRSADLTNQIFNILGFFSVFQGVVLTAVSQLKSSSKPLCGMVWVPALLSGVAAAVTIIGVWIKFSTLQELEISIYNEKVAQSEVAARATRLRAQGTNFNFSKHAREDRPRRKPSSWISSSRIGVIVALFFFTCLFILSYVVILCNSLTVHKWNKHLSSEA